MPTPIQESAIRAIVEAYRVASYAIRLPGGRRVVLRIGARTPPELDTFLDAAMPGANVTNAGDRHANDPDAADPIHAHVRATDGSEFDVCAGLITAWHPFSQAAPLTENRARQRELLARLRRCARRVFPASGYDAGWREPGFAVFGIETEALDGLARAFRQNAIVTFRAGGDVRLRFHRDDWRDALAHRDVDLAPPAHA